MNNNQWTNCKVHAYDYTGSSCEDINNNPATRDKSGYYNINDSQWIYCIMTTADAYNYTGLSSCEDIYNSNPETVIKSGYYCINYSQWKYCKVDMYNYTGSSCEDIYSTNSDTRDKSGYYHINDSQWIYCIMTTADAYNYTGSSLVRTSTTEIKKLLLSQDIIVSITTNGPIVKFMYIIILDHLVCKFT